MAGPGDILAQIAGQPQPGLQTPLAAPASSPIPAAPAAPGGLDPAVLNQLAAPSPGGLPGGLDPAIAEAAMQADQIFQQMTGQSFLQLSQAGAVPPEMVEQFMQIIQQVIGGTTTGTQEVGVTSPQSIM